MLNGVKTEQLATIERLFSKIRNEKVTLFIGSGFSLNSGAPTASEIIKSIKNQCHGIKKTELKDVSEEYVERCGDNKEKLIEVLESLFAPKATNDITQKVLTRIPQIKQIFTTNYDSYIEDAFEDACHVIREEKDIVDCNFEKVQIYKLHGDFVNKNDIVITQTDYNNFFDTNKYSLMWSLLKTAIMSTHVVFVGYSLDDLNIRNILKKIREICGDIPKEMFLIAPDAAQYKFDFYKRYNISWIKSTAEELFPDLEQNIKDHIFDDYRKKRVSHKTFIKFCNIHGINPDIRENEQSNEVLRMQGCKGKALNRQISIRISYNPLANFDFEKSGPIKEEGPLKGKYAITVPASDMSLFESRVNGIKEYGLEDVQNFYLMPIPREVQVKIRVPDRDFIGTSTCSILQMSPTTYLCTFDFDICKFVLTIAREDDKSNIQIVNVHVETNNTYKSQDNALRWIEVIDALFSGEKVLFPELNELQLQISEKQEHPFKAFKEYYTFVQTIELKSAVSFAKYYNFTVNRYAAAQKLYHWLTQQEIYHLTPKGGPELTLEFTNEISSNELLKTSPTHRWGLAVSRDIAPIVFNDHTFIIPYDYLYFDNCNVFDIQLQANGIIKMKVRNNAPAYQEFLTSSPKFQDLSHQDLITISVQEFPE